jgi:hypothetical protein
MRASGVMSDATRSRRDDMNDKFKVYSSTFKTLAITRERPTSERIQSIVMNFEL